VDSIGTVLSLVGGGNPRRTDGRVWLVWFGCWILCRVLARAGSVCPCGRVVPVGRSLHPIRVCGKLTAFRDVASLWSPSCCGKWARRAEWSGVCSVFGMHDKRLDCLTLLRFVFDLYSVFQNWVEHAGRLPTHPTHGFRGDVPTPEQHIPEASLRSRGSASGQPQPLFRGRASPTPMPLLAQE